MSHRSPDQPSSGWRGRIALIVGIAIGAVLVFATVLSLVIHFVLLQTDRFNWLEAPKPSSQSWPTRVDADAQAAPSR